MEYVYAAMLLHKASKPINEDNVMKVLQSVGLKVDPIRVKSLVAALSEVDIEEAIKSGPSLMPAVVTSAKAAEPAEPSGEEEKEEKEEKEEEALEGLGALFG